MAERLTVGVFKQLAALSLDPRPEVRNSAVKTLHSTLVSNANRLRYMT